MYCQVIGSVHDSLPRTLLGVRRGLLLQDENLQGVPARPVLPELAPNILSPEAESRNERCPLARS